MIYIYIYRDYESDDPITIVKAAFFSIATQDLVLISSRGVLQDLGLQRSAAEVQLWQCCFPEKNPPDTPLKINGRTEFPGGLVQIIFLSK